MHIFYWCRGQDDNIGDVVLRRRFLRELRQMGSVHILVGGASPGFIEAMQFTSDDKLYRSSPDWMARMYSTAFREKIILAFNPGELRVGWKSALAHAALLPAQLLGKIRGSKSIRAGIAVRGRGRLCSIPILMSDWLSDLTAWRDTATADDRPWGLMCPDWAFDEVVESVHPNGHPRDKLLLTYRGDQPMLSAAALEGIRVFALDQGLEIIVFSQVRRDNDRGELLAEALSCQNIAWGDNESHLRQEMKVRALMKSSQIVISDRIHALIIGTTEGAIPVGVIPYEDRKVGPHLSAGFLQEVSKDVRAMSAEQVRWFLADVVERGPEIQESLVRSRSEVAALARRVRDVCLVH